MPFKRFKTEKLIRDHLPRILRSKGIGLNERIMDQEEFLSRLKDKFLEEAQEVNSCQNLEDLSEKLADMLEVIQSIAKATGLSMHQIEQKRLEKLKTKGGFDCKIYCNYVDIEETNAAITYYLEKPQQYPPVNNPEHELDCIFCQIARHEKKS
jgi:predicted house-cleaning noncanonical NTP pyrophosphatase (MazG superfamily)